MPPTSDDDRHEPSLELPSLKLPLGRRKRSTAEPEPAGPRAAVTTAEPARRRAVPRRRPAFAAVPGRWAAALTGAVVGLGGTAATYAAMTACEAVRGVSTCGGAPGFFILVAILVLMVLAGAGLLQLFGATAAGSTSFLAVGVVTVVVMLLLLEVIFSPWMFLVIPALAAASYLVAHRVSTRVGQEDTGRRDWT